MGQFTTAPTADQKVDIKFGFSGDTDSRLTVEAWGIPSYQQNTFPQDATDAVRLFSFQIGLATSVSEPAHSQR